MSAIQRTWVEARHSINQDNGFLCPVCGGSRFQTYREVVSELKEIPQGLDRARYVHAQVWRCRICGLYRTKSFLDARQPAELYYDSSICFNASRSKTRIAGASSISSTDELSLIRTCPPARLLEVGCGAGQFLLRASRAGYDVTGIDMDPRAVSFCRDELALNAHCGTLESLPEKEKFDVIVLLGVLEHMEQPEPFLVGVRQHLNAGGEVLIGVPNVDCLNQWVSRLSRHDWDMFLEPGHCYHYNVRTLTALARRTGLLLCRWATGTIVIRGKIPILPLRHAFLERMVWRAVSAHAWIRGFYLASLRFLDVFRAGDMLLATFRGDDQIHD